MLFKDIYKKEVIIIENGESLGVITHVYVDKNYEIAYLSTPTHAFKVADMFAYKDVVLLSKNVVLIDISTIADMHLLTLEAKVYDTKGAYLGMVNDLTISCRKKEKSFFVGESEYKLKHIVSSNLSTIILNPTLKALPSEKAKKNIIMEEISLPLSFNAKAERVIPDYSFLIGRKVSSEISDLHRNFVIKRGTVITEKILASAKRAGKIVDLVMKSTH